jgi:hypothetical protein
MVEEKRAEILPSAPYNVASDYCALTTGTAFCLSFWATDQKATFSAWLKSVKAAGRAKLSVVREQYQGADCVRISVGEPNSGGTYWLDAEHGLAFRGYESATERKGHRWVSKRKVVTEIVEAAPGVWCPQRAFQEYYSPDTNRPRENRLLFHASKVIANDPFFDEGVFRAPIPSGYIVTDKILGTRYRMGLDDRALERQLDQLAESVRNPSSISTGAQHQDSNQADATTPSLAQEVRRDTAQELGATGVHGKANSRAWIYGLVLIIALAVSSLAVLLVRKRGTRVPPHAT